MSHLVDFKNVSEVGLETSPVATALAGLRANEARYFHNKYKAEFVTTPVTKSKERRPALAIFLILNNFTLKHILNLIF